MKIAVFVDCQNDFLKGGRLAFGYPEKDNFDEVVALAQYCTENGYRCYATRDTHGSNYSSTLEGKNLPVEHCIELSEGWMVNDRLMKVLEGKCTFVNKPTFGSYDLVECILDDSKNENVEEILICGYCTSICVLANSVLLRAKFPNASIKVVGCCCGDVSRDSHEAAIATMKMQQIEVVEEFNFSATEDG